MAPPGRSLLLGLVLLLGGARLAAHNAPGAAVLLDFKTDRLAAELRLPLSELELAFRAPLLAEPAAVVATHRAALTAYVAQHLAVRAPDGRPWAVAVRDLRVALEEQPLDLVVRVELRPPAGAPLRKFTLTYDVISHEVMNHFAVVSVRGDPPELLGIMRSFIKELAVDRTAGHPWHGFRAAVALGGHHIRAGTDHLLFLLVLLLPAPLLAAGRRWGPCGGTRRSLVRLLQIVTAFTLGHSLTLIAGAVGWLRAPVAPVEIAVAGSILVSALHALRPIFPGRETWIAAGFGLVHGLAFATVIAEFGLGPADTAWAIFGFNLGIELMQLLVVVLTMPWLLLLSRTRAYPAVRVGGAIFAAGAALGWIAERAFALPNPFGPFVEGLAAHGLWLVAGLAVASLLATRLLRPPGTGVAKS